MKFLHLTYQFQYSDMLEAILDEHGIVNYARYPRIAGRDSDGKHANSQAFPGHLAAIHALVPDGALDALFDRLNEFRKEKEAHEHLRAVVLPVERVLPENAHEANEKYKAGS